MSTPFLLCLFHLTALPALGHSCSKEDPQSFLHTASVSGHVASHSQNLSPCVQQEGPPNISAHSSCLSWHLWDQQSSEGSLGLCCRPVTSVSDCVWVPTPDHMRHWCSKEDPRRFLHTALWPVQLLVWIALLGVTFAMPNSVFLVWGQVRPVPALSVFRFSGLMTESKQACLRRILLLHSSSLREVVGALAQWQGVTVLLRSLVMSTGWSCAVKMRGHGLLHVHARQGDPHTCLHILAHLNAPHMAMAASCSPASCGCFPRLHSRQTQLSAWGSKLSRCSWTTCPCALAAT